MIDWAGIHGDDFRGTRALITGGAGFIGSHLAAALVQLGAAVVVIDDLVGGSRDNLRHLPSVSFLEGSILDRDLLKRATQGCDWIFHQAALGSVPRSVEEPRLFQSVNVDGTLNVLEIARSEKGIRRVMFAASSSAYGNNSVPWVESMPIDPQSPYAANKAAGEALFRAYAGSYGIDTVCLRYFNIFGPRQNANSAYAAVIAAFAASLQQGKPPTIYGDGSQTRDFTFVDNAVHANLLAAKHRGPLGGQVVNVGCGAAVSVNALAGRMARAYHREDLKPTYRPARAGDLLHSFADLTRAQAILGYRPLVGLDAGLEATVGWYRNPS